MGIEQMYGRGDTRIYAPMGGKVLDMYKKAKKVTVTDIKRRESNQAPIDKMNEPSQQTTQSDEIKTTNTYNLGSLKRYFGTEEGSIITSAGGEALYGGEKHKNDHTK
jgi:hypothetical protein